MEIATHFQVPQNSCKSEKCYKILIHCHTGITYPKSDNKKSNLPVQFPLSGNSSTSALLPLDSGTWEFASEWVSSVWNTLYRDKIFFLEIDEMKKKNYNETSRGADNLNFCSSVIFFKTKKKTERREREIVR